MMVSVIRKISIVPIIKEDTAPVAVKISSLIPMDSANLFCQVVFTGKESVLHADPPSSIPKVNASSMVASSTETLVVSHAIKV